MYAISAYVYTCAFKAHVYCVCNINACSLSACSFSGTQSQVRWFRSMTDIWALSIPSHSLMRTEDLLQPRMTRVCVFGNGR